MTLHEEDTKPITARTRLIIRGATTHFRPPYSRGIIDYCRERNINYVVITTNMAAHGLKNRLHEFKSAGDSFAVEDMHCFKGDDDSLLASLSGKACDEPISRDEVVSSFGGLAAVVRRIRKAKGRVLILCQVGRNRSFTTGFVYYLVYYGAGKSVVENLRDFKQWHGLSYDMTVQRDGSQRLDERDVSLPWMRDLRRLFEDETGLVSKDKIRKFMATAKKDCDAAAAAPKPPKRRRSSSKRRGAASKKNRRGSLVGR